MENVLQTIQNRRFEPRTSGDWRRELPVLYGKQVVLREICEADAEPLFDLVSSAEVSRFISAPPSSVERFEQFVELATSQREAGSHICYVVTIRGFETAIGLFQIREIEPGFEVAEWGFALGSAFWGTGIFREAAELVLEFVFNTLRVHRLEARAAVRNGRGNSALRKMGAVQEGILRKSFKRDGKYVDQALHAIVAEDWRATHRGVTMPRDTVSVH